MWSMREVQPTNETNKNWKKKENLHFGMGNYTVCFIWNPVIGHWCECEKVEPPLENSLTDFSQKTKHATTIWPKNCIPGYLSKERIVIHTHTHTQSTKHGYSSLFVVINIWNQPRCPSAGEELNKPWYIHTREHCLAIKKNKLLMHTTTWINQKIMTAKSLKLPYYVS